ncbi:unnamed protein product, partial [Amoebophrya sp. A25]
MLEDQLRRNDLGTLKPEFKRADRRLNQVCDQMEDLARRYGRARHFSLSLFILKARENQIEDLLRGACAKGLLPSIENSQAELEKCIAAAHVFVSSRRSERNLNFTLGNFLDCEAVYVRDEMLHKQRQTLYGCIADALDAWVPQ